MDDPGSWTTFLILPLCLLGAAYFAATEISYSSLDTFKAEQLAKDGNRRAGQVLQITQHFDRALNTILIGNNIAHIAFASVATDIAIRYWGVASVPWVTLVTTLIVFFFSELLPKLYGKNSFAYALAVAPSLQVLMTIFSPVSYVFSRISHGIEKALGKLMPGSRSTENHYTEEEFYSLIRTANAESTLTQQKQELLNSAIVFDNIPVEAAYQPLDSLDMIDFDASFDEWVDQVKASSYSRLPVYRKSRGNIVGVLRVKKFLKNYLQGREFHVKDVMSRVAYTTFSTPIDDVLRKMSREKNHFNVVKDDTGRVRGIITLEDILEELVGEIYDENDRQQKTRKR